MSLLQILSYKEYQKALLFTEEQCVLLGQLANLRNLTFGGTKKPGEVLLKSLDRRGYTVQQYKNLISSHFNKKSITYHPNSKLAILIGNEKYVHLPKLATPSHDCTSLSTGLKSLGFDVITLRDVTKSVLMAILPKIFEAVADDSYCVIFYGGHGCELDNNICLLGVECPSENIDIDDCITQNDILKELANCKPELVIFIMDMCRINLDSTNPDQQDSVYNLPSTFIPNNLLLCYSTQSSSTAYEELQIDCSEIIDNEVTYELHTSDLVRVVPGTSQYISALCHHLNDDLDVEAMLCRVHEEVEQATKSQKPMNIKYGESKRSLHDPAKGDSKALYSKLKEISKEFYGMI